MISKWFDSVFGCSHNHYSFPRSVSKGSRRTGAASLTGTYVVCLDCGSEMPYDWDAMEVVSTAAQNRKYLHALATKEAS